MASLRFRIINVFTRNLERLSGNPLCVFEDGAGLDERTMLALARQFNLSETTFILPSERATARIRIFTPSFEMPFAGHPTLGSAYVVRALGRASDHLTLETHAGVIPVESSGARFRLRANDPMVREVEGSRAELASALGLELRDLGERPLWVKAGKEQLIIPLTSEAAVRRAAPKLEGLARFKSEDDQCMAYVFAELSPERVLARFFFNLGPSVLEDPATGSATANLGGFMLATGRALPLRFEIAQGEHCARPSVLHLEVSSEPCIFVAGDVVELASGTVVL